MSISKPFDLAVVGEINPDLILTGDVTPVFGQVEKMVADASLTTGSSACIFALGAARLGLRVTFTGKVGLDPFGQFMLAQLSGHGVDVSGVVRDPDLKTGLSVILSRGADRAILTYAGTISELRYEEIQLDRLALARHLHLSSYFMLEKLRPQVPELFRQARNLGLTVSMDTNYDPAGRWDVQEAINEVDVFLPNAAELRAITGETDPGQGAQQLARDGRIVAVKLGAQGGLACGQGRSAASAALAVPVVDTTGAGDTFDAGFLYGYLHGWDLERSLRLACACGSLSTRAVGGTAAQPTLAEASQYLEF